MRRLLFLTIVVVMVASFAVAQDEPIMSPPQKPMPQVIPRTTEGAMNTITVPVGTRIPVELEHAINTKSARDGDAIYCITNFPVVIDGKVAIPPGTYMQGTIQHAQRAGRVKGKAEVLLHFTTLIFPSGYTVMLPGSVGGMPGSDTAQMKSKDSEGTVQGDGDKTHDAATIGKVAATGAGIGAIAGQSAKGALGGGLAGAAVGLASVLLTRGPDVHLQRGTLIEVSLERPITIDRDRARKRE
jgi:type IV secretory pathway VirB10-like protein